RAVCRPCGSSLFWRLQGRSIAFVAVGLLDDQSGLRLTEEIFIDNRPDWLPPREGAAQRTEAEMKAQLAAFLEKEKSS
ncbi:MAG: GFA family protein, partial [Rhodobacteraceae bacterium]